MRRLKKSMSKPLKNSYIICFSPVKWSFLTQRYQHLMREFSRKNRIIYIDPPSPLKVVDFFKEKIELNNLEENISIVKSQFFLRSSSSLAIMLKNYLKISEFIKSLIIKEAFYGDIILWIARPDGWLMEYLLKNKINNPFVSIYDCADFHAGFKRSGFINILLSVLFKNTTLINHEKIGLYRADIIFAASEKLLLKIKKQGLKPYLLNNAATSQIKVSNNYDIRFGRCKVIFIGAIYEWVNSEIILKAAQNIRSADFYIIGPTRQNYVYQKAFEKESNIYLIPTMPHDKLMDFLCNMDIGILPFKDTPLCHFSNPIKIYEYLAAGLIVVSSINYKEFSNCSCFNWARDRCFVNRLKGVIKSLQEKNISNNYRVPTWCDRINSATAKIEDFKKRGEQQSNKLKKRIFFVTGFFGKHNLGDNSLLYEFARWAVNADPLGELFLICSRPDAHEIENIAERIESDLGMKCRYVDTFSIIGTFFLFEFLFKNLIQRSIHPELYVLGGYFHGETNRALLNAIIHFVSLKTKTCIIWHGGFGPFKLGTWKAFEKYFLSFLHGQNYFSKFLFLVRDGQSYDRVLKIADKRRLFYTEDPLLNRSKKILKKSVENKNTSEEVDILFIPGNMSGFRNKYLQALLIRKLIKKNKKMDLIFLRSPGFLKNIWGKLFFSASGMSRIERILCIETDFNKLCKIVSGYPTIISGRYHGLVAAYGQKKRLIPIPLYEKLKREYIKDGFLKNRPWSFE